MKNKSIIILFVLVISILISACGSSTESSKNVDVNALYTELTSSADIPEMIVLDDNQILNYYGIKADECKSMKLCISDDGLRVDEIWIIEASDSAVAEKLLKLAQSRIEQICSETANYLPDQNKVASNSVALKCGNYVGLFLTPDASSMADTFSKSVS